MILKNDKKNILTGDRPTGRLHLGHFVGSLKNRVKLQDDYNQYILIADLQALTDHADDPSILRKNILEVMLDYLAVGLDPNKNTFILQSQIPELTELTFYFMNLVTISRLNRNPTLKNEIKQKKMEASIPVGFFTYPVSQAADIALFDAEIVPVGTDQLPMIEQTNEIIRKFNKTYAPIFKTVRAIASSTTGRLPGINGKAKMSKSLNNAIFLSDSSEDIKNKIMSMYTDPNHLKISDPGNIEGNMVFTYLDYFDEDKNKVKEFKEWYRRGGLGDVKLKKYLNDVIQEIIEPIRTRRKEYSKDMAFVENLLKEHTEKARLAAQIKIREVREAINLDFFD